MTLSIYSQKLFNSSLDKKQGGLLVELQKSEFSGSMLLQATRSQQWKLIFYLGRIIYATGGNHAVRRYQRNLGIYLPQVKVEFLQLRQNPQLKSDLQTEQCWEYELLDIWLKEAKIDAKQVNQFITAQVKEILFDIARARQVTIDYKHDIVYSSPLSLINSEQITAEAWQEWEEWQKARLADRSPDAAPLIIKPEELKQKVPQKTFEGMIKLLNGKKTIRELSLELTQQNLIKFTSLVKSYIDTGLIELVEVPDFSSPIKEIDTYVPLIACIDDSPIICQIMETIVKDCGYRFLAISDELRAVNILLKHKPDLLFLDYIMPKINGYELCGMLRKVPQFAQLPIVILTAHQNLLEQFRGKISGCSTLIYKPVKAEIVKATINEHLNPNYTQKNSLGNQRTDNSAVNQLKSKSLHFSV